jgi:hypothetical protein
MVKLPTDTGKPMLNVPSDDTLKLMGDSAFSQRLRNERYRREYLLEERGTVC